MCSPTGLPWILHELDVGPRAKSPQLIQTEAYLAEEKVGVGTRAQASHPSVRSTNRPTPNHKFLPQKKYRKLPFQLIHIWQVPA